MFVVVMGSGDENKVKTTCTSGYVYIILNGCGVHSTLGPLTYVTMLNNWFDKCNKTIFV